MAGYYDKNKDYSKELQRTDLSSAERERLTQERQNKIDDKYGGREPNMIGSDKKYSQVSGSSSGGSSSGSFGGREYDRSDNGGGIYGAPTSNSQQKNYTQGGTTYRTGPDLSRRPDLAGGYQISNGYTVIYDKDGYAIKASKGTADYTPGRDTNAANGTYNSAGAWTDNEILTALDRAKIAAIRGQMQRGEITGDQANQAANAIRAGYGYTIDKNGYVTDNGALTRVNDLRKRLGLDTNPESAESAYYRYLMESNTTSAGQGSGNLKSFEDFLAESGGTQAGGSGLGTGAQRVTDISAGGSASTNFSTSQTGRSYDVGDGNDYLKELYARKVAAELAALKGAYEANTATLDASRAQIPQTFDIARNSAADQNARSRSAFQEMAVANGLNTGTTGQAALAQDIVYQQNLSALDRQQAQSLADLDLKRSQLDTEYQNAIAEAENTGNAELANALYAEYVRQQNRQPTQTTTSAASTVKPNLTASQAQNAIKNGVITDDVIAAFDYYYGQGAYESLYGSGNATSSETGNSDSDSRKSAYSNGNLTNEQVKQLQAYYGASPDGKWGANSKAAAGGLTADEAWEAYQRTVAGGGSDGMVPSFFTASITSLNTALKSGNTASVSNWLNNRWGKLSNAQKQSVQSLLAQYGMNYEG